MSQRCLIPMLAAFVVTACGSGGGGDDDDTPAQAGALQLSSATQSVGEGSGTITVTVTRTGGSDGAVSATLATSNGAATAGEDFTAVTTTVSFAAGDSAAKSVSIPLTNDALEESAEAFTATLSAPTGGATIGTPATVTITIQDNDGPLPPGHGLNDTGVTGCSNGVNNGLACSDAAAGTDQFPRQDGDLGRDTTANDASDGAAGFSFVKLDGAGVPLADQSAAFGSTPWDCVRDNVTGLTWEVKPDDDSVRDRDWTFSWFDSNGSDSGERGMRNGGECADTTNCDTQKYIAAVNAAGTCGLDDWRLPSRSELSSLVHYGGAAAPLVDGGFFPDAASAAYWSISSAGPLAWAVDSADGSVRVIAKFSAQPVRLVSGSGAR
jgi:hypothetical protein